MGLARKVRPCVRPAGPSELLSLSADPRAPAASRSLAPSRGSARGAGAWGPEGNGGGSVDSGSPLSGKQVLQGKVSYGISTTSYVSRRRAPEIWVRINSDKNQMRARGHLPPVSAGCPIARPPGLMPAFSFSFRPREPQIQNGFRQTNRDEAQIQNGLREPQIQNAHRQTNRDEPAHLLADRS